MKTRTAGDIWAALGVMILLVLIADFSSLFSGNNDNNRENDDPFAPGRAPERISKCTWEEVLVVPHSCDGRVISLDGWLGVYEGVYEKHGPLAILLYKDKESYELGRPLSFLPLRDNKNFVNAYKGGDLDEWKKLNGRYVKCVGIFREDLLKTSFYGYFEPPYELNLHPLNKDYPEGEPSDIRVEGAVWPHTGSH